MNKKKLLALLMALVMTLTLLPLTALAEEFDPSSLPQANVTRLEGKHDISLIALDTDAELTGNLKNLLTNNIVGTVDVDTIYRFTSSATNNKVDTYGDWFCDYRVTFTQLVKKNSMGLYGSYAGYLDIAFLAPVDVKANTPMYLLSALGLDDTLTYREVVNKVQTFDCGVFNVGACNADTVMTVELVMKNPDTGVWYPVATEQYTFGAATPITSGAAKFVFDDANGNYNIVKSTFTSAQNGTFTTPSQVVSVSATVNETDATATVIVDEVEKTVAVAVDNTTFTQTAAELTKQNVEGLVTSLLGTDLPEEHNTLDLRVDYTEQGETQTETVKTVSYDAEPYAIVNKGTNSAETVKLTNDDLNDKVSFTFRLPVPSSMGVAVGGKVAVVHKSDDPDRYPTENFTATVEAGDTASSGQNYITITTTHFSQFTLTDITPQTGMYVVNLDTGAQYATLKAAIDEVGNGETLALLDNITNAVGISVPSNKNFTVDFNGKTYTLNNPGAGSSGTETNGFQLLKDSTIIFKNGTINIAATNTTLAPAPAKNIMRIIQNYANLTLDNMVIDATNQYGGQDYPVSFNNGASIIKDTIIQGTTNDNIAFDVCRYASYDSVNVTVTGDKSVINGDVEIYASGSNAKNGFGLTLESGTLTGDILVDNTAKAAMLASPGITEVTKKNTFTQEPAAGYKWTDNNDGTSSLELKAYGERIGVSLRRRVKSAERNVVVNTSTDYRVGYQWFLPTGAAVNTTDSTLSWSKDGENWIPVTMENIDGNTTYLVITGIPEDAFDTPIYTKLELHYTLDNQAMSVVIGENDGADNVEAVARSMKDLTGAANAPWVQYARYLLHEIDSLTIS